MLCPQCGKQFSSKSSLSRHRRESCPYREVNAHSAPKKIKLNKCNNGSQNLPGPSGVQFRAKKRNNESENVPGPSGVQNQRKSQEVIIHCPQCYKKMPKKQLMGHLKSSSHKKVISVVEDGVEKLQSAFKNRISSYRFSTKNQCTDIAQFLEEVKPKVISIIEKHIKTFFSLKINMELFGLYVIEEKELSDIKSFNTKNKIVTHSLSLSNMYDEFKEDIMEKASTFQEKDSGKFF